ncbi:MAG: type II toxin-antitoxin system VapC family toxin [Candidatus Omnitrophica bacterium]|nr:type II toxin-antitoxin system VapC family toxin [Candidatus Omnitrophota bacterium]
MRIYFDTSAFAKRYIQEPGSDELDKLLETATGVAVSILCYPELMSALGRRFRCEEISQQDFDSIESQFLQDLQDIEVIQIHPSAVFRAIGYLKSTSLKTLDALHVASASVWEAHLFATGDKKQMALAQEVGLPVWFTGEETD